MKRILLLFLCYLPLAARAQTDEFRSAYDEFRQQAEQEYSDFRAKANAEYAEFLKQAWKEYKVLPAIPKPKDETVPPVVMPEEDKDKPIESAPVPIKDVVTPPAPEPQPVPIAPIREQEQEDVAVGFAFYGTPCQVRCSKNLSLRLSDCSGESLSAAWTTLSGGVCNNTIRDCLALRINMQLSDWAYLNLINEFAQAMLGHTNEATMLMAYIYCQSGYKMRLATANGSLVMLYASKHTIYNAAYFTIDNENYYPFDNSCNALMVCDAAYPQEKSLSLLIPSAQCLAYSGSAERTLTSKRYPEVSVKAQVNKNLIDFYNTYPTSEIDGNFMTRWAMYANTPMEKEVSESLYPALRTLISGLSEKEATERLLNWVQTAFVYEYDDKVWGHDRAFFAEETLYYPYCDCEDRSILLTRIVRDLLGLDCILIYYPGHLASAVCFSSQVAGDYIQLSGKRFVVCDATYIGAPIGKTMPGMDNAAAKVILLQ